MLCPKVLLWSCFGVLSVSAILSNKGKAETGALERVWDASSEDATPVQRVVALLEKMKSELEAEAASEGETFEEMSCWCDSNEKEKNQAIADADAKITDLEGLNQEQAAKYGELTTQIAQMKEDIASEEASFKEARAIREKEAAEFNEMETEMLSTITNLKNAIAVLGRHYGAGGSFVQMESPVLASLREVLQDAALKYDLLVASRAPRGVSARSGASLLAVGTHDAGGQGVSLAAQLQKELGLAPGSSENVLPLDLAQHRLAQSAKETARGSATFMQAQQPYYKSYTPQSSTIFGILNRMLDEFQSNLSQEQKDELSKRESFKALQTSKMSFLDAAKEKLDALEMDHAQTSKALGDSREELDLTHKQRSTDVEFLQTLRLECQDLSTEYADRSKTRSEELSAVTEAIAVLTADDAKDLFAKTMSFLQLTSENSDATQAEAVRRSRAATVLRRAAADPDLFSSDDFLSGLAQSWRDRHETQATVASTPRSQLATLAVTTQLDSFTKVKEAMDKMVADLKAQQSEEATVKATCQKEFSENEKGTFAKSEEKNGLEDKLDTLAKTIETLTSEVDSHKAEIAETKKAIKQASEAREKENMEFQTTVNEQRETQAILNKALARLGAFYKKKSVESLAQVKSKQVPPKQFNEYKKHGGSVSVMSLLQQIIEDSASLEKEAIGAETQAQSAYESFVKESNAVIESLSSSVTAKSETMAGAKLDEETSKGDLLNVEGELESLAAYKADLHTQCDFLLKNFDIRQAARIQEIEAIQAAKAILSGAK